MGKFHLSLLDNYHQQALEHVQAGQWVEARVMIEKQKLMTGLDSIGENNYQVIVNQLQTFVPSQDQFNLTSLFMGISLYHLSLIVILCLFIQALYSKINGEKLIRLQHSIIPLCLVFGILILENYFPIAVTQNKINIYSGPSKIFETGATIQAGEKVLLMKTEQPKWQRVLYPPNSQGWISVDNNMIKIGRYSK